MKELTRVYSVFEADIICSKLRAAGIESFAQGKEHMAMDWLVQPALDGIRILIREEDYSQAVVIFQDIDETVTLKKSYIPRMVSWSLFIILGIPTFAGLIATLIYYIS